jgi:mannitol-1-/sugar-/sorbitol-6-phosphatase
MKIACRALISDLDGVLVDSTAVVERVWREWALENRLDPQEVLAVAHGRRTIDTIRMITPQLDAQQETDRLEDKEARLSDGMPVIPGAPALLAGLPAGRWAIVTSGSLLIATARLAAGKLPVPEILVTANDVSAGKPDPQGYRLAATRLGVAPQDCVVIEDSPAGIAAGKAAGMRVVALPTTHAIAELGQADWIANELGEIELIFA